MSLMLAYAVHVTYVVLLGHTTACVLVLHTLIGAINGLVIAIGSGGW